MLDLDRVEKAVKLHGIPYKRESEKIIAFDAWIPETGEQLQSILTVNNKGSLFVDGMKTSLRDYLGY